MPGEIVKNYAGTTLLNGGYGDAAPGVNASAVTASDVTVLQGIRGIFVGTGGNLAVVMGANTVTLKNVGSGTLLPIAPTKVMATNTTATDIVAIY